MYKVLLVDDEPAVLSMEKRAIKTQTDMFTVVGEAYDVQNAIGLYRQLKPDVILTDIKMPKESGIQLIRYLSEQENDKVVCIAVSGYDDFDYVHDAFMYGAFDYMLKPVEPKKVGELFKRISRLLIATEKNNFTPKMPQPKLSSQELVEEIEQYIRTHLSENNSIISICSRFAINQPYLSKIFKKYRNSTYNDFLTGLRIEEAKRLLALEEEYLIGEIAEMVGFSDQFYFSKVFKNITGHSPRSYRKWVSGSN